MALDERAQVQLEELYKAWYAGIDKDGGKNGWGSICGGITILENLFSDYTLELGRHQTSKGTQLKGAGISLGNRVLERFGASERIRTGEFGRTSRGAPLAAKRLIELLKPLHLESLSAQDRNESLSYLQERMTRTLQQLLEYNIETIEFDPSNSFQRALTHVLATVSNAASGAVAQHLVEAKLEMRFPDIPIENHHASEADAPTKRPGDIIVKDYVFHITISPQNAVYEKCKINLNHNNSVYLLVPQKRLFPAQETAKKHGILDNISLQSIEAFVAQNIEEMGQFTKEKVIEQRRKLIDIYNRRIQDVHERHAPLLSIGKEGALEIEAVDTDQLASLAEKNLWS